MKKNKLIVIGFMSAKSCYLNISLDDAIKRYVAQNDLSISEFESSELYEIEEFSFDVEFGAYDVWDTE